MSMFKAAGLKLGATAAMIALALAALALTAGDAGAQAAPETRGLAISPTTFELSANPGDSLQNTIRLDNVSDAILEINADIRNFSALGEEGQIKLEDSEDDYSLAAWMKVEPSTVTLAPGESRQFTFTIDVPASGQPGGHFGSVVFSTRVPQNVGGSAASVGQEIGGLVLLRVAGEAREALTVSSFHAVKVTDAEKGETKPAGLLPTGPVPFEARIANEGNVYLKPKGVITVTDMFNRRVGEFPLEAQNVLPDAVRKMTANWGSSFLLGKYDAQLTLTYGINNEQIVTSTASFWAIPYKNTGFQVAVAAFIVLSFVTIRWRRRVFASLRVLFGKG